MYGHLSDMTRDIAIGSAKASVTPWALVPDATQRLFCHLRRLQYYKWYLVGRGPIKDLHLGPQATSYSLVQDKNWQGQLTEMLIHFWLLWNCEQSYGMYIKCCRFRYSTRHYKKIGNIFKVIIIKMFGPYKLKVVTQLME